METTRRGFIKTAAVTAVTAATVNPALAEARDLTKTEWVKSVCRFCGTGCGVQLGVRGGKLVALRGDPKHPTTKGLVCAKALFLPKSSPRPIGSSTRWCGATASSSASVGMRR